MRVFANLPLEFLDRIGRDYFLGGPQVIVVTGQTNSGKTAVLRALAHEARRWLQHWQLRVVDDEGLRDLLSRAREDDPNGPYLAQTATLLQRLATTAYQEGQVLLIEIPQRRVPTAPFNGLVGSWTAASVASLVLQVARQPDGHEVTALKSRYGAEEELSCRFSLEPVPSPWQVLEAPR